MVPWLWAFTSLYIFYGQEVHASDCTDNVCIQQHGSFIEDLMTAQWTNDTATLFLRGFYNTSLGQCIKSQAKGTRPDVSCYLPETVMDFHLGDFIITGASNIDPATYDAIADFTFIGHDGVNWVTPYGTAHGAKALVEKCATESDPANCVCAALGEPVGPDDMFHKSYNLSNKVIMLKILGEKLHELNVRMASGNEEGANDEWLPGGYTSNDGGKNAGPNKEAVISTVWAGEYCWYPLSDQEGTFCYPNCTIQCDPGLPMCNVTACNKTDITGSVADGTVSSFPIMDWSRIHAPELVGLSTFNMIMMAVVIFICARCKKVGRKKVYQPVQEVESEMEQIQEMSAPSDESGDY